GPAQQRRLARGGRQPPVERGEERVRQRGGHCRRRPESGGRGRVAASGGGGSGGGEAHGRRVGSWGRVAQRGAWWGAPRPGTRLDRITTPPVARESEPSSGSGPFTGASTPRRSARALVALAREQPPATHDRRARGPGPVRQGVRRAAHSRVAPRRPSADL